MNRIKYNGKYGCFFSDEELLFLGLQYVDTANVLPENNKFLGLQFLKGFNTTEKQEALRQAVNCITSKMDVNAGRDWVAVYMVYCFYTGNQKLKKRYADFFHDIDLLLPGLLGNVCQDAVTDSQRYRKYTQMLSIECNNWFILNGCLPSLNEWTSSQYAYRVEKNRQRLIQSLVVEMLKFLQP